MSLHAKLATQKILSLGLGKCFNLCYQEAHVDVFSPGQNLTQIVFLIQSSLHPSIEWHSNLREVSKFDIVHQSATPIRAANSEQQATS